MGVVSLTCPLAFSDVVLGAIYELSLSENWEEYGTLTPDECATIMRTAYLTAHVKDALLADMLVSAWVLEEPSGVRRDSIGTNHLSDHNTVGTRQGVTGLAASFIRANSEYLSVDDNSQLDFSVNPFTICAWVQLDDLAATQRIITKSAASNLEFFIYYNLSSNRFLFQLSTDGVNLNYSAQATNFGAPTVGQWNLLTCYRSVSKGKIGIQINDGTPNETTFTGSIWNGSGQLRLSDVSSPLNGGLDSVLLFNDVLSVEQVKWLYNLGNGRSFQEIITYTE